MTWTIKIRTSPGALMTADYECPFHGRFEATVERDANGDPPSLAPCPSIWIDDDDPPLDVRCDEPSPWRISCPPVHTQFVVSASQGKPAPKPHPKSMDTRMRAEGRKNDFRKQRKKIREEERHARLKRYLS